MRFGTIYPGNHRNEKLENSEKVPARLKKNQTQTENIGNNVSLFVGGWEIRENILENSQTSSTLENGES